MQITESNAMAAFATARDEYLSTMGQVPSEAIEYLKPGDDYSLGGIAVHVNYVLEHYANVLGAMIAAGFNESRPEDPAGLQERADARAKASLTSEEVRAELARTERLHRRVSEIISGVGDLDRKAPVWYPGGNEAYPTSGADVLGWLTDHYAEHVPQIRALAAEAKSPDGTSAMAVVTAFCQAFDRADVDGVMALMTDDCIFESTLPPPDGERLVGHAAVQGYWEQFFATTEAPRFDNEEMFGAGDRVVSRWRFSWGGGAGGGHVRGIDLYRVRDGKVSEKLAYVKG
jgi:ketosteroid isomerase-like protein